MPSNSALEWFPKIEKVGLPVPETIFVPYDHRAYCGAMEGGGGDTDYPKVHKAVVEAAMRIGFPVFIRTDLASAKHNGPKDYKASSAKDIGHVLSATVEDNEMKLWLSSEAPKAFMVREWLDLEAPFKAFAKHPIAREWRFFADRNGELCRHFYWPEKAIKFYRKREAPKDWERKRRMMENAGPSAGLSVLARQAAAAQEGEETWSIDFAKDKTGKWWLIDMALAKASWHPNDCKNKFGTEREDE